MRPQQFDQAGDSSPRRPVTLDDHRFRADIHDARAEDARTDCTTSPRVWLVDLHLDQRQVAADVGHVGHVFHLDHVDQLEQLLAAPAPHRASHPRQSSCARCAAISVRPTVRLSMLKLRRRNRLATRFNTPGLFSTSATKVCFIGLYSLLVQTAFCDGQRAADHVVQIGAGRHHRVDDVVLFDHELDQHRAVVDALRPLDGAGSSVAAA